MTWFGPERIEVTRTLKSGQEIIDWQALEYLHWRDQIEAVENRVNQQNPKSDADSCQSP